MVDNTGKNKRELLLRISEVRSLGFSIIEDVGIPLNATSIKDSPEYSDEKKKVIFKPIPFSGFESLNFLTNVTVREVKKEVLTASVPIAKIDENLFDLFFKMILSK